MTIDKKLPVTVLSGFLGAGKTTWILGASSILQSNDFKYKSDSVISLFVDIRSI